MAPAIVVFVFLVIAGFLCRDERFVSPLGLAFFAMSGGAAAAATWFTVAVILTVWSRDGRTMLLLWVVAPLLTGLACCAGGVALSLGERLWLRTVIVPRLAAIRAYAGGRLNSGKDHQAVTIDGYTFHGVMVTRLGVGFFTSSGGPPTNPGGIFVPFAGVAVEPFSFDEAGYTRRALQRDHPFCGFTQLRPTCLDDVYWFSTS